MTSSEWGRVDDDGTVYVRTADGERAVGSYPAGTPEEALSFFTERFEALAFEVQLLEQRVNGEKLTPEEAAESVKTVRAQVSDANAVGDLGSLVGRLDALGPVLAAQREARKAERAAKTAEAKEQKEQIVLEAEKVADGTDWRNGANRLRELLDQWKALPRIDRPSDDSLWKRFSGARTTYTRRRKAHFAEQDEKRDTARVVKERLCKEAEALADLHRVGSDGRQVPRPDARLEGRRPRPQGRRRRPLEAVPRRPGRLLRCPRRRQRRPRRRVRDQRRRQGRPAGRGRGPAPRLQKAGPDFEAAKKTFRGIAEKWDAAGKVPRDRMKDLEARMRVVENAIRSVEDDAWKRSDPEKSARADDMVTKLEVAIGKVEADLEKAREAGNDKKVKELEDNLESRRSFLDMARRAQADYS